MALGRRRNATAAATYKLCSLLLFYPDSELTYLLLAVLIVMGVWMTFVFNLASKSPYNYRDTVGVWWRSLFSLNPDVDAATRAPLIYQLHAIVAWGFWATFPFSRLVHAWSIPLQYLGRPYILYRRRFSSGRTTLR